MDTSEEMACIKITLSAILIAFGPKMDEVTGEWRRKHHNEEFQYFQDCDKNTLFLKKIYIFVGLFVFLYRLMSY
jgi:hypothetical protein